MMWGQVIRLVFGWIDGGEMVPAYFFFFLIGKQKTIIKEKLERVQVVHDDEQLEKRTKNTTKEAIRKLS